MPASRTKRRAGLYSVFVVVAAGILFAGFGITIPPDPETRLSGASMLAALEDYDGALEACDKVLSEHPDNVEARVFRATFLAQAKRFEESLVAYEDAIARVESAKLKRSLRADRASVLLHAGRDTEFRAARDELARAGVDKYVHLLDGIAANKRSDWPTAVEALRRAAEADPDDRIARSFLVDALVAHAKESLGSGDLAASAEHFGAALAVDPTRVDVALKAADVLIALEREAEAVRVLEAAGLRERGVPAMLFRAATSLLERAEKALAVQVLATALKGDATSIETLFAKSPAWSKVRARKTLRELVSERVTHPETGLTASGAVIGSSGKNK